MDDKVWLQASALERRISILLVTHYPGPRQCDSNIPPGTAHWNDKQDAYPTFKPGGLDRMSHERD